MSDGMLVVAWRRPNVERTKTYRSRCANVGGVEALQVFQGGGLVLQGNHCFWARIISINILIFYFFLLNSFILMNKNEK